MKSRRLIDQLVAYRRAGAPARSGGQRQRSIVRRCAFMSTALRTPLAIRRLIAPKRTLRLGMASSFSKRSVANTNANGENQTASWTPLLGMSIRALRNARRPRKLWRVWPRSNAAEAMFQCLTLGGLVKSASKDEEDATATSQLFADPGVVQQLLIKCRLALPRREVPSPRSRSNNNVAGRPHTCASIA
jgi:hypothetical protein